MLQKTDIRHICQTCQHVFQTCLQTFEFIDSQKTGADRIQTFLSEIFAQIVIRSMNVIINGTLKSV